MLIPIAVIAVLAIVLIICLVKSAANWNWVQITFVFLVFVMAIFASMAVSRSIKTRTAWYNQHKSNVEALKRQKDARDVALYGPKNAIEYDTTSLKGVNAHLTNSLLGTGRVWNNGMAANQNGQIVVTFSTSDGASAATQLQQDMSVFAFADGAATIDDQTVPIPLHFIGTFQVASISGNDVTFDAKFVTKVGTNEFNQPTTTWSFFEKMPSDARDIFLQDMGVDETVDMSQYREALRNKYLPAASMGMDPASVEYERLLDEFTFDGRALNAIDSWLEQQSDRIDDRFDPDPENRFVEMLFNESQEFAVDSPGSIENEGSFNNIGQAVDPQLQLGSTARVDKDERVKIDRLSGVDSYPLSEDDDQPPLTDSVDAEVVGEFFVRRLRDYPYLLEELSNQTEKMDESKTRVEANIADTNILVTDAQTQISNRDDIISKLYDDIGRLQKDLDDITTLLGAREAEYNDKMDQIKTYYNQILELYEEIKKKQDGALSAALPQSDDRGLANK